MSTEIYKNINSSNNLMVGSVLPQAPKQIQIQTQNHEAHQEITRNLFSTTAQESLMTPPNQFIIQNLQKMLV